MSKGSSRKIIFNRKRLNVRKYLKLKNILITLLVIILCVSTVTIIGEEILKRKVSKSTVSYKEQDNTKKLDTSNENKENSNNSTQNIDKKESDEKNTSDDVHFMMLGELMMGGKVTKNLDYNYMIAFKEIYNITKKADFTYANLATNITNLDKIEDAKTDYLVTKNILNAMNALGIDSVSIANDHITDYPDEIIKNTIKLLEENDRFVAGRENQPVYFEQNGKKIAIVSTNSVIIGTKNNYTRNQISMYSEENIKKNIAEAKKMSDFVIVDMHFGKGESSFGDSEPMKQIAHVAMTNGADAVIGTHAIGIQPIEMYNNKPIIYTTGYLMTDLEYETTKSNYIFDLIFDDNMKLTQIEMIPTYIKDNKENVLCKNFDENLATVNMKNLNNGNIQNGLNSKVENDKIIIDF